MKIEKILLTVIIAGSFTYLVSCNEKSDDSAHENYDSLFLGFRFGMEKQDFYDYCWEMNRQKIFTHGPTNQSVEYRLTDELEDPVMMRFYPSFYEDKIYEMPVEFTYEAWAPWNAQFKADTLLIKLLPVFKKWYGDDFTVIDHRTMGKVYARIDGSRRINLFRKNDQIVQAVFTDLSIEKKMKADQENDNQN